MSGTNTGQGPSMKTIAAGSMAGATLEWYDFLVYGTLSALVLGQLFFPSSNQLVSTMAAFASFGTGFVARPVGAAVFGHFGDRAGRKKMLVITIVLAGGSTTLIGVLPTYDQAGYWAPLLLVVLRLIQGFGIGGEFGGATLTAVEHSPRSRRGFWGAVPQMGVSLGFFIATGVVNALSGALSQSAFLSWGWRIPFLISLPLMGIGLFIRLRVQETPAFTEIKSKGTQSRLPVLELARTQPKVTLLALGAGLVNTMSAQIFQSFAIVYVGTTLGLPNTVILTGIMIMIAVQFFLLPAAGALSDRVGRRPVYMTGVVWVGVAGFPLFWLFDTQATALIWLAITLAGIGNPLMLGVQGTFFSELFGTRVRYSGISLAFQLAAVGGGFTPLIVTGLFTAADEQSWVVSVFLLGLGLLSFICTYLLTETMQPPGGKRGQGDIQDLLDTPTEVK